MFSKCVDNTVGKAEIAIMSSAPFPTAFSKDLKCRIVKTRACLGKGLKGFLDNSLCTFCHNHPFLFFNRVSTKPNSVDLLNLDFFGSSASTPTGGGYNLPSPMSPMSDGSSVFNSDTSAVNTSLSSASKYCSMVFSILS